MREIKFKVRDPILKTFILWILSPRSMLQNNLSFLDKDCIFLQFTWICDKNKKEIYEWDILMVWDEKDNKHANPCYHQRNEKVVFNNWCFKITNSYMSNWTYNSILHKYEVIGNIYQNPKLIEPVS